MAPRRLPRRPRSLRPRCVAAPRWCRPSPVHVSPHIPTSLSSAAVALLLGRLIPAPTVLLIIGLFVRSTPLPKPHPAPRYASSPVLLVRVGTAANAQFGRRMCVILRIILRIILSIILRVVVGVVLGVVSTLRRVPLLLVLALVLALLRMLHVGGI